MAEIGASASCSGATPWAALATRRSAGGRPSASQRACETTTAIAAPSCGWLVLAGVRVPAGDM